MKIEFYKYQGTGNDFVMILDWQKTFDTNNKALIEKLCNRRFGIGADGLILLQPHESADFYMQYFNSDGAESSMCGNGGRCIAQFAFDLKITQNKELTFYAIDGIHKALKTKNGIKLQMKDVDVVNKIDNEIFELNTGSPHFVKFFAEPITNQNFVENAKTIRYNNTYKTEGINVNFINLKGLKNIAIRTYERGVEDETLSCGTGVTAAALSAAMYNGFPSGQNQVYVKAIGGNLMVNFWFNKNENTFKDIWLEGPAEFVFKGVVEI